LVKFINKFLKQFLNKNMSIFGRDKIKVYKNTTKKYAK